MQDRVKPLEGVRNFRDFGGYRGRLGQIVSGKLFRSAHFSEPSATDKAFLDGLGLPLLVDLRRQDERQRQPNVWPHTAPMSEAAEPRVTVIAADGDGAEAPHLALLRRPDLDAEQVREYMLKLYERMPFDPRLVGLFRLWLKGLGSHGAGVVHCAAGKDRTGLAVALTHALLGIDEATIFDDYLLTNTAVDVAAHMPQIEASLSAYAGRPVSAAVVKPFLGVEADYLARALEAIHSQHGTIERYVVDVLAVEHADIDALRRTYIV